MWANYLIPILKIDSANIIFILLSKKNISLGVIREDDMLKK